MAKSKGKDEAPAEKVVCRNRRALHQYEIIETFEAGMVLKGTEVKSLRAGHANLEDAYARLEGDELWLLKAEIPEYAMGNIMNHEPKRKRKLLLHRREIEKFAKGTSERGFTIVPLKIYFRRGHAKIELAIGKGKKTHDKRETLKAKTAKRDMQRAMGPRRRGAQ
jgi:SsrA-binding protein